LKPEEINLSYSDGLLFHRMELFIDGKIPAVNLFSGPFYFMEQLGFRKVIDTTFMMAAMVSHDADPEDTKKYFRALRRAQRDIDLRPELYRHHYLKEFPERFHDMMDLSRFGPGERIVFEPYSQDIFEETFRWIEARHIFPEGGMGQGNYAEAVISLASE
jgi:hypothetical protein